VYASLRKTASAPNRGDPYSIPGVSRICGGQSGTGTGYSPITSGFPCHYLSTTAPCTYFSHYQQRVILQICGVVK